MRVVIDTNVLISALLSGKGAPALVLRLAFEGKIDLIFSPQTVNEHWRVLYYSKIQKRLSKLEIPMETAEQALHHLVEISKVFPGKERVAFTLRPDSRHKHAEMTSRNDGHSLLWSCTKVSDHGSLRLGFPNRTESLLRFAHGQ